MQLAAGRREVDRPAQVVVRDLELASDQRHVPEVEERDRSEPRATDRRATLRRVR